MLWSNAPMFARRKILLAQAVLPLLAVLLAGCGPKDYRFIAIGTAGVTGVYYPVGGALAMIMNDEAETLNVRASVEATAGSVYNINAVLNGDLDFGVSQADRQYQAYRGLAEWTDRGPQTRLRAVCSLYTEMVTLVGADDAGIEEIADLRDKRVNIGNPGSGSRINAIDALRSAGLDWQADLQAQGIRASESPKLLQDGRIDAFFFTAGHPAGTFSEASVGTRGMRFIPITTLDALIEEAPYYSAAQIPIKPYPQMLNEEDIPTIGMKTTLVTSVDVPEDLVYGLLQGLVEHFERFKKQHPALSFLEPEDLARDNQAPWHPGAERFYREQGWLE